jgi:transmembrane sensor
MSATDERVRGLIAQRAADWFVANRAGLTQQERQSFNDWLRESPVHVEEYLALASIARDLRRACAASAPSIEALVASARGEADAKVESVWSRIVANVTDTPSRGGWFSTGGWRAAAVVLSALTVVSIGLVLFHNLTPTANRVSESEAVTTLRYQTGHGEQQTHVLEDNSVLHLNTDSAVAIRYSKARRDVILTSGEAVFEVIHDADRPFRVVAKSAEIVDLGTRFDVRLRASSTLVTVVEGRVAVRAAAGSPQGGLATESVQVAAGQQVSVGEGMQPGAPVAVDVQRATAWLQRQISFEHEPLERVAAEFNRYASKSIEITTPALRSLQVSGVFRTDDTDAFIAFLRSLDRVRVEVTANRIVVSEEGDP